MRRQQSAQTARRRTRTGGFRTQHRPRTQRCPDEMYLVAGGTSSPADSFIFIGFQFERRAAANADGLSKFCCTVSIAGAVPNDFFPDVVRRISVPVFAFLLQRHALSPPLIPPPVRRSVLTFAVLGWDLALMERVAGRCSEARSAPPKLWLEPSPDAEHYAAGN